MRITAVAATELFGGSAQHPLQIIRVTVRNDAPAQPGPSPIQVRVEGAGVSTPTAFDMELPEPGGERAAEVGVHLAPPYQPGSPRQVTAVAEGNGERAELAAEIRAAETGWTMWMVSHFHYDPVWWDTQGEFTESRLLLPDEHGRLPDVRTAFELVSCTWRTPARTRTTSSCWPRSTTSSRTWTPTRSTGPSCGSSSPTAGWRSSAATTTSRTPT